MHAVTTLTLLASLAMGVLAEKPGAELYLFRDANCNLPQQIAQAEDGSSGQFSVDLRSAKAGVDEDNCASKFP